MSALDRLKEKIETWKKRIEELEQENHALKAEHTQALVGDHLDEALLSDLAECQNTVAALQQDIIEKDQEIEAIIIKVEALLE